MVICILLLGNHWHILAHFIRKFQFNCLQSFQTESTKTHLTLSIKYVAFVQTLTCYDDPASHPYISNEEREYLKTEIGQLKRSDDLPPTPWTRILTNGPIWAFIIVQVKLIDIHENAFSQYQKSIIF